MRLILITLLSVFFFVTVPATAQDLQWFANDHFQLTEVSDEALVVTYQKQPWEAFTLYLGEADFSKNTVMSFLVQSATSADLRIDLIDKEGNQATDSSTKIKLLGNSDSKLVTYDFGKLAEKIDLSNISHVHFYVNPGIKSTGELVIKNIKLPEGATTKNKKDVLVYPNPVIDILNIKTIGQSFDELVIFDIQGKEIARKEVPTTSYYEWRIGHLPSGIYQYQINHQKKTIEADRLLIE